MIIKNSSILSLSFLLIYVGFATISVLSIYPKDNLHGYLPDTISLFVTFITFPASMLSFGFRYAESEILFPVFIIQLIMFILVWFVSFLIIKKLTQ
jgi:hypothetical protein